MRRFRRGRRAWRAHKVLCAYPGDLTCSQRVCDLKLLKERREANDTSGVGLTHISDEACESRGSEGVSKWSLSKRKHCQHKRLEAVEHEAEK